MNETIYYKSPVGALCIKSDQGAIAEVSFVNRNSSDLEEALDYHQPHSAIINKCISQLDEYFAGRLFRFELDLLQPGTPFQQSVWSGLLKIGYGKTCSYLTLSKELGNTKAIRAVGTANGKNNIAIIVPCHRVIGSNGSLVGYGGGLWRKKWLLEHEARFAHGVRTLF
jgi:methylated-DNA-[protein]-cysteine S-methyltransferase